MKANVPRSKMSKKQRQLLDRGRRAVWGVNPVTRRPLDSKVYDRKKFRIDREGLDRDFFCAWFSAIIGGNGCWRVS